MYSPLFHPPASVVVASPSPATPGTPSSPVVKSTPAAPTQERAHAPADIASPLYLSVETLPSSRKKHKSDSKIKAFRRLFGLHDEVLYHDFTCSLQRSVWCHGRLYVSGNYVCFHSNVFGQTLTVTLRFDEISNVEKTAHFKIFSSGLAITTFGGERLKFRSFRRRDKCYRVLTGMLNPEVRQKLALRQDPLQHTEGEMLSPLVNEPGASQPCPRCPTTPHSAGGAGEECPADAQPPSDIVRPHSTPVGEVAAAAHPRHSHSHGHAGRIHTHTGHVQEEEEEEEKSGDSDPDSEALDMDAEALADAQRAAAAEASQEDELRGPDEKQQGQILDDWETLYEDIEMACIFDETFPVSVAQFFKLLFSDDNAVYSFVSFHESEGNHEVKLTRWSDCQDFGRCRQLTFIGDIKGAPPWVAKQTRLQKVQKYRFLNRDVLLLDVDSASLDVPFGDCFHTMEKWEVRNEQTPEGAQRCRVKIQMGTRFTKSIRTPGAKSIIRNRAQAESKKSLQSWFTKVMPHVTRALASLSPPLPGRLPAAAAAVGAAAAGRVEGQTRPASAASGNSPVMTTIPPLSRPSSGSSASPLSVPTPPALPISASSSSSAVPLLASIPSTPSSPSIASVPGGELDAEGSINAAGEYRSLQSPRLPPAAVAGPAGDQQSRQAKWIMAGMMLLLLLSLIMQAVMYMELRQLRAEHTALAASHGVYRVSPPTARLLHADL